MHADKGDRLLVDLARLAPEGEDISGEVDIVDYEQKYVHPFGGVRYSLNVRLYGSELLVRGRLEQDFTVVCSRCGNEFDLTAKVDDYVFSMEVGEKDEWADISEDARESVILALPTYPVCDESCPGVPAAQDRPSDERWNVLDGLKLSNTRENEDNKKN